MLAPFSLSKRMLGPALFVITLIPWPSMIRVLCLKFAWLQAQYTLPALILKLLVRSIASPLTYPPRTSPSTETYPKTGISFWRLFRLKPMVLNIVWTLITSLINNLYTCLTSLKVSVGIRVSVSSATPALEALVLHLLRQIQGPGDHTITASLLHHLNAHDQTVWRHKVLRWFLLLPTTTTFDATAAAACFWSPWKTNRFCTTSIFYFQILPLFHDSNSTTSITKSHQHCNLWFYHLQRLTTQIQTYCILKY